MRTQRLICGLLAVVGVLTLSSGEAAAFRITRQYPTITFTYEIRPSVYRIGGQAMVDSIHAADWMWESASLSDVVNAVHCDDCTDIRYVDFYAGDNQQGGVTAEVQRVNNLSDGVGCREDGVWCSLEFDVNENWNTTGQVRDATWLDLRAVATHEFGHWMGLNHAVMDGGGAQEIVASHAVPNTMFWAVNYGDTYQRDIAQDDANGVRAARNWQFHITANMGFEHANAPFWGYVMTGTGISWARYCNDWTGAHQGACFVQFGGAGTTISQNHHNRGFLSDRQLFGSVFVRNRGSTMATITLEVERLDVGAGTSVTCTVAPHPTAWSQCTTGLTSNPGGQVRYRLVLRNNQGGLFDVDSLQLRWQ